MFSDSLGDMCKMVILPPKEFMTLKLRTTVLVNNIDLELLSVDFLSSLGEFDPTSNKFFNLEEKATLYKPTWAFLLA